MPYSEAHRKATHKYVLANRDQITEYNTNWKRENRELVNQQQIKNYYIRKAFNYEVNAKIFRRILL